VGHRRTLDEVWTWEEWLNDLDTREILEDLFDSVPGSQRARPAIEEADARFRGAASAADDCVWGERNRESHGWTREKTGGTGRNRRAAISGRDAQRSSGVSDEPWGSRQTES
jgi:hypothetical protein